MPSYCFPQAPVQPDSDTRQKSYEHHEHGRSVLPQLIKNEPKTKPESKDDMLGEALAAAEKQHKIEHRHAIAAAHKAEHHKQHPPTTPVH